MARVHLEDVTIRKINAEIDNMSPQFSRSSFGTARMRKPLYVMGLPWLDAKCAPSHCMTPLLSWTGKGENKMEKNMSVKIKAV